MDSEPLTSTVRPDTMAIITVRVIKSFEYRTVRNHILKDIDLVSTTVADLIEEMKKVIATDGSFRPYRHTEFDAVKIYTNAHGSKTTNLIINLDHPEWLLTDHSKTLHDYGVMNETELSLFNLKAYETYLANPIDAWDD